MFFARRAEWTWRAPALLLCLVLFADCASSKRRRAANTRIPAAPALVGTVVLVNAEDGFVLIDSGTQPPPPPAAVLKTSANSVESAELKAGDVRKRPFVIADIVKGTPRKGDAVFLTPSPSKSPR